MDNLVIIGAIVTQLGLIIVTCLVGMSTVACSEVQTICKKIVFAQGIAFIVSSIVMMWISILN